MYDNFANLTHLYIETMICFSKQADKYIEIQVDIKIWIALRCNGIHDALGIDGKGFLSQYLSNS